eukprot:3320462-Rhodomonas_salina.1
MQARAEPDCGGQNGRIAIISSQAGSVEWRFTQNANEGTQPAASQPDSLLHTRASFALDLGAYELMSGTW